VEPWKAQLAHDRLVVTGGGSGIGRDTALAAAATGASVHVLGRRREALEETVGLAADLPGEVRAHVADVRDPDSLEAAFAAVEAAGAPAPALVHAAAAVEYCPAADLTPEAFRTVVESVLFGAFNTLHRWSRPLLQSSSPGTGVFLTSCIATAGTPGAAHSSSAKAGVEAMVRTIAREWGPKGIRLNAVGPGFVPVERTAAMWEDDEVSAPIRDLIALGRPGTTAEIVGPIMFLLSEAASYVTGEVLVPDGGFRLTPHVVPRWKFDGGDDR
jgi:NAD(P)-dependent dehydrogenase (short-subunit alcohol dehydrogenase family)